MKKKTVPEYEGEHPKPKSRVMTQSALVNFREDVKEQEQKNGSV